MSDDLNGLNRHVEREALVEDARTFARTLESAHPDPYAGHGGRVAYHRNLAELVRSIPDDGESIRRFYRRLQRFAAGVRDGHTKIEPPETLKDGFDGRFPLGFRVVGTNLYVDTVYDDAHVDLLGDRLLSVDGLSVSKLRVRQSKAVSADNQYGDLVNLAGALETGGDELAYVLESSVDSMTVTVETDGSTCERMLNPTEAEEPVASLETTITQPETNGEPAYRFLDDGSTALLTLPDCHSHRELHEYVASVGGVLGGYYDTAETYRRLVGEPVPDDRDEMVAGLPSASEILTDLADEMAEAGTDTLIIDTRDNSGGSSILAYLLLYVLYGWDGTVKAGGDQYSIAKDSELYRRGYGEDGQIDETPNPAGFDFESYFQSPEDAAKETIEELSEYSPTFANAFENGDEGNPNGYYRPDTTIVVTSATTYSAGIEPAFLLSKLDTTVVGVPSGQSPNGPRDILVDELPNTGLEYKLSYRHHEFLPDEPGDVFEPNVELTPERFESFDCAGDAEIRLALAYANDELLSE